MSGPRAGELDAAALVAAALAEDVGDGDRTSLWAVPAGARGAARIVAREAGVVAGAGPAGEVFRAVDPELEARWERADGDRVGAGDVVATVEGPLGGLLTAERTALNFLGRLSGIATLTARFVAAVEGTGCRITDTRKTTPGWRRLEKAAVAAGGGANHRFGLYDMVLVKENHIRAAGGVTAVLERVLPPARAEGLPVEIEVTTLEELEQALAASPDRILLDNMGPDRLRACVARTASADPPRPLLEASGGVALASVREIAGTGVDVVSVGALTHSAPALDLSLLVEEA